MPCIVRGVPACHRRAARWRSLQSLAFVAFALFALSTFVALPAQAQSAMHIRGDIIRMDNQSAEAGPLVVRLHDGSTLSIQLAYNFHSVEVGPVAHGRLVPGKYVGVAAEPADDGTLRALAVLLFFDDYKGSDEGHHPWDLGARATMSNGTISGMVAGRDSRALTLRYAGGEKTIAVADGVPVVAMLGGGRTVLKPGTHVFIKATRQRDGTITAGRIYYGKDGFTPPM